MADIPTDRALDSSLAVLRDPYRFIGRRCRELGSDAFRTRLLLRRTVCMSGAEAGRLFYDESAFRRRGATPRAVQATLFGIGGVQGLDDAAHRHRRSLFLAATGPDAVERLAEAFAGECRRAAEHWPGRARVVLYDEFREILTRAVCAWAGVAVPEEDVPRLSRQLASLFENADTLALRHWRARRARRRAERWLGDLVTRERDGGSIFPSGSIAARFASHRDLGGALLDPRVAAVELLNVLRPVVAVSVYATFVAHALHTHPSTRGPLTDPDARRRFVQEVRRTYPFFPFLAAIARRDVDWHGARIPAGTRVLFDVYGTDHDPRIWGDPERFRPERFRDGEPDAYSFVPQGGGDRETSHRCPGEPATIALMEAATNFLANELRYTVPPQDVTLDDRHLPALPRDRMVIADVSLPGRAHGTAP